MTKTPSQMKMMKEIGRKELTFQDKLILLRERYKRAGETLENMVGVTRITLSRWVNGHTSDIREELWKRLVSAAKGLIDEDDRPIPAVHEHIAAPKPEPKPVAKPTPAKPKPKDDDEFIL